MAGQFQFTFEDYQKAAIKYRKELLMIPIIGIEKTTQFMTLRPGIRYKEAVGTLDGDAQFAPYKANRSHDFDLTLGHRILETFFGNVVEKFEPNSAVSTVLGAIGATKGDGQKLTPTAKHVLALIARKLSHHLNAAIWNAERNANGDTTKDLFNGFDTITAAEITAGNISAANNNYLKLTDEITTASAVDILKSIMWGLDDNLRDEDVYIYCSQDIVDKYNEGYLLSHAGIPYNNKYNQTVLEGSGGKMVFCPLANKRDSKFIHITTKSNMLVGVDQMSDVESIEVARFAPFVLDYIATIFFGVQFESIAPWRMKVIELADESEETEGNENQGGGNDNQGGGGDNQGGGSENQGGGDDNQGGNG